MWALLYALRPAQSLLGALRPSTSLVASEIRYDPFLTGSLRSVTSLVAGEISQDPSLASLLLPDPSLSGSHRLNPSNAGELRPNPAHSYFIDRPGDAWLLTAIPLQFAQFFVCMVKFLRWKQQRDRAHKMLRQ